MGLPKQVEEAGKRADELKKEVEGKTGDPKDGKKPPEGDTTPKDPENNPEPAPEPDKKQPDPKPQEEDWKHKFDVLQGKYNKEVKEVRDKLAAVDMDKIQSDLANLNQQVVQLTQTNATLAKQNEELKAKAEKPEPQTSNDITEDDLKHLRELELDDKAIEIIRKMAGGSGQVDLSGTINEVKTQVNELKEGVEEAKTETQKSRVDAFMSTVRASVPNFDDINNDQGFISWLSTTVSPQYPGKTRQGVLNEAGQNLDAVAATAIFNEYIEETKTKAQEPAEEPKPNPLENEIEPNNSASTDPSNIPAEGKHYSAQDIQHFYKEMAIGAASNYTKGEWAGKKAECQAMDADIKKASIEGRITK